MRTFLQELTELTKQHNLAIGGCGCCDSPWVEEINTPERDFIFDNLRWDKDKEEYIANVSLKF